MSKNPETNAGKPAEQDQVHQQQVSGRPSDQSAPASGAKFNLTEAELHARGRKSATVQRAKPKKDDGNAIYIVGAAAVVPFAPLEHFWRAMWLIAAATLEVDRSSVHFAPAAELQNDQLMASAHFCMSDDLLESLAKTETWSVFVLGLRLLVHPNLWQENRLATDFKGQPWERMLEAVREARDEIAGQRLPCKVDVEFSRVDQVITIGPQLAPCRPPVVSVTTEHVIGRSVGFLLGDVHLMHFTTKKGHACFDVQFRPEEKTIKQVRELSQEHAPIVELELEVLRHDGSVVARTLRGIKLIIEPLFTED